MKNIFKTIWQTIKLAWYVDKKFVLWTILLTILGGLVPIGLGYASKLAIDELIHISNPQGVISVALLGFIASRYLLEAMQDFQRAFQYQYTQRLARFKIQNFLNLELASKVSLLDIDYFQNPKTQDLIKKVTEESFGRIPSQVNQVFFVLSYSTTLIGSFLALLPFGFWIPLVAMAATYPRFKIGRETSDLEWSLFSWRTPLSRKLSYVTKILEKEDSITEVRIAGARNAFLNRVTKIQDKLIKDKSRPLYIFIRKIWIPILLEAGLIFLLVYLKLPSVVTGIISIGGLTFFMQMFSQVLSNTQSLNDEILGLIENSRYIRDYFELMDLPPLVVEKEPGHTFEEVKPPKIKFQNVGFQYPNGTKVLKNISFSVLPGEHLAIVGPNGAGKTTLIKLLLRFYDPTKGSIIINDFDLKDLKRENWYKFIGTLFQNFGKYPLTVDENIAFSEIDDPDMKKVKEAARMSGANEFIEKFPDKYEQQLGREFDGEELSIGQWQKVALARAFYEEAPVLILDEPTSAIDAEAEAEIFDNLNKVYKDKTVIFISHRFSTVRNADKIIVLKDGQIAEDGTHESLIAQKGVYARMFKKQAKGYID